jgi:hypothetical protein
MIPDVRVRAANNVNGGAVGTSNLHTDRELLEGREQDVLVEIRNGGAWGVRSAGEQSSVPSGNTPMQCTRLFTSFSMRM